MALMDFIKKQFIEILEWTEDGDEVLALNVSDIDLGRGLVMIRRGKGVLGGSSRSAR